MSTGAAGHVKSWIQRKTVHKNNDKFISEQPHKNFHCCLRGLEEHKEAAAVLDWGSREILSKIYNIVYLCKVNIMIISSLLLYVYSKLKSIYIFPSKYVSYDLLAV